MLTLKTQILVGAIAVVHSSMISSDPNARLFEHMIPVFRAEEAKLIAADKEPILAGETTSSLDDAVGKVQRLVLAGHLDRERADKLIDTLTAAEHVRGIASLMQGVVASSGL